MIVLKKPEEIERMRTSGKLLAAVMREASELITPGRTTAELNDLIYTRITEAGAVPSFLGYNGFKGSACISVNEEVVHGIPGPRVLAEGDVVTLDIGVFLDGFHADSAWTFPVGTIATETQRLLNVTRESLMQGIAKAKVGNTIGDIAHAVQKYVESNGYGIVRDLVGHGIGQKLHEEPSVPNFGKPGVGPRLKEGMTLAIEPMVNMGTWRVKTLSDDWTVVTADGKPSAHFEHTVAITAKGPDILTLA